MNLSSGRHEECTPPDKQAHRQDQSVLLCQPLQHTLAMHQTSHEPGPACRMHAIDTPVPAFEHTADASSSLRFAQHCQDVTACYAADGIQGSRAPASVWQATGISSFAAMHTLPPSLKAVRLTELPRTAQRACSLHAAPATKLKQATPGATDIMAAQALPARQCFSRCTMRSSCCP